MTEPTRRDFLGALAASALTPIATSAPARHAARLSRPSVAPAFRIRTITAGVQLASAANLAAVQVAVASLKRTKATLVEQGYQVSTLRVTTNPFIAGLSRGERATALEGLKALDAMAASEGFSVSIGPVLMKDQAEDGLAEWVLELVGATKRISSSVMIASPDGGVHRKAARVAADVIALLGRSTPNGIGNFRFAAAANIPAGTPFFPVGWHGGPDSLALGLETPGVVQAAFTGASDFDDATRRLRAALNEACAPLEVANLAAAKREGRAYLGVDTSPAPSLDRSIGAALEALIGGPFGSASTLSACAATTEALRSLSVKTCGYSGLMLPVLEDPVLAKRATEGRYGLQDLLLFSSVCGTGLDVVPLPGDTPSEQLAKVIVDTAALSNKWKKPLSARLFVVPGKAVGEMATFTDAMLTGCKVMSAG